MASRSFEVCTMFCTKLPYPRRVYYFACISDVSDVAYPFRLKSVHSQKKCKLGHFHESFLEVDLAWIYIHFCIQVSQVTSLAQFTFHENYENSNDSNEPKLMIKEMNDQVYKCIFQDVILLQE